MRFEPSQSTSKRSGVRTSPHTPADADSGLVAPPCSDNNPGIVIRDVVPMNRQDVAAVARLHMELFRDIGPMAQLGELFVREFCYATLIRDGLIKAAICEVDGEPAGMVAYTDRSISFHRSAISGHFLYVVWLTLYSLLRHPSTFLRLPRALKLMLSRRGEQQLLGEDPMAEVLAVGVLPEFRTPQFIRSTGLRVGDALQDYVIEFFRGLELDRVRMVVDADNTPALFYWHRAGGHFEPYEHGGKPSILIWLDLNHAGLMEEPRSSLNENA